MNDEALKEVGRALAEGYPSPDTAARQSELTDE